MQYGRCSSQSLATIGTDLTHIQDFAPFISQTMTIELISKHTPLFVRITNSDVSLWQAKKITVLFDRETVLEMADIASMFPTTGKVATVELPPTL